MVVIVVIPVAHVAASTIVALEIAAIGAVSRATVAKWIPFRIAASNSRYTFCSPLENAVWKNKKNAKPNLNTDSNHLNT